MGDSHNTRQGRIPITDDWMERRIWPRVTKPDGEDGCWLWQGARSRAGYGQNMTARAHTGSSYLHRAVWILEHGPIADGYEVDHMCFNPPCLNLAHLRLLTLAENRTIGRRNSIRRPTTRERAERAEKQRDEALAEIEALKAEIARLRGEQ